METNPKIRREAFGNLISRTIDQSLNLGSSRNPNIFFGGIEGTQKAVRKGKMPRILS